MGRPRERVECGRLLGLDAPNAIFDSRPALEIEQRNFPMDVFRELFVVAPGGGPEDCVLVIEVDPFLPPPHIDV